MDLAHLEGGEGGWMSTAQEQYEADQVTFGNIQVLFPGGREGSFHIYPMGELKAFLADAGFGAVEVKPWKTKAGKPRVIVEAKYTGQSSPLA